MFCPQCNSKNEHQVQCGDNVFTLRFVPSAELTEQCGKDTFGCCDHPNEGRNILIDQSLMGLDRMDTIVHEMIHGALPELREGFVRRLATGIAKMLWTDGYRRQD